MYPSHVHKEQNVALAKLSEWSMRSETEWHGRYLASTSTTKIENVNFVYESKGPDNILEDKKVAHYFSINGKTKVVDVTERIVL